MQFNPGGNSLQAKIAASVGPYVKQNRNEELDEVSSKQHFRRSEMALTNTMCAIEAIAFLVRYKHGVEVTSHQVSVVTDFDRLDSGKQSRTVTIVLKGSAGDAGSRVVVEKTFAKGEDILEGLRKEVGRGHWS